MGRGACSVLFVMCLDLAAKEHEKKGIIKKKTENE